MTTLEDIAKQFLDVWFKENHWNNKNDNYGVYNRASWGFKDTIDNILNEKLKSKAKTVENEDLQRIFDDIDLLYRKWVILDNARHYMFEYNEDEGDKICRRQMDVSELEELVDSALLVIDGNKELMKKLYAKLKLAIKFNFCLTCGESPYYDILDRVSELM